MSMIDTSVISETAALVRKRGALPVAPLAMPVQRLEWPRRRMGRFALLSLALRGAVLGRPTRTGR